MCVCYLPDEQRRYVFVGLEVIRSDSPAGGDGVCALSPPAAAEGGWGDQTNRKQNQAEKSA